MTKEYKTFCNDSDIQQGIGFLSIKDGVNTADLIDQVATIDYHVCNKMGTSIPTMFSRMFLFQSAYYDIVSLERKHDENQNFINKGRAHNYVRNPETGTQYTSVYHHLISEHLDMLEFLFVYGADITIQNWQYPDFKKCLIDNGDNIDEDNSAKKGLYKLSDAFKNAFKDTPFLKELCGDRTMEVLLFKYKGIFVGGTSPSLVVFTNPNWKREMSLQGIELNGLFNDKNPRPLHVRSLPFRKLMTLMAIGGMLDDHPSLKYFKQYIIDSRDNGYDPDILNWWNDIVVENGVREFAELVKPEIEKIAEPIPFSEDGKTTEIKSPLVSVPIFRQIKNQNFETQYKINPTRDFDKWRHEEINGEIVDLRGEPMLIVPKGIPGVRYYERELWQDSTQILQYSELCNQYLSQRMVPGKKILYPIVTADDFLENNIVELAYNVDKDHFFTACAQNFNFMLPIKKMFFRFFTFDDLKNNLTITLDRDNDNVIEKVNVKLVIPMKDQKVGSFAIIRSYSYAENSPYHIVGCRKPSEAFNLGIFPFFKSVVKPKLNSYYFMLGETKTKIKCWLGDFGKSGFIIPRDGHEGGELNFTSRSVKEALSTSYVKHEGAFDYIEVQATISKDNVVTGMFFPLMPDVGTGIDNKWIYSVDFGTSNTHIVAADKGNNGGINKPVTFEFSSESQQIVTFSSANSTKFGAFEDDVVREFVPKVETAQVKFPMRSVIYEKIGADTNSNLFAERNVGFNYKREIAKTFSCNEYVSDLKWNVNHQAMFMCRVEAYCYQLLLMLRNHSLTHGGTEQIQVAVTYPLAMRPSQLRIVKDAWRKAWRKLVDNNKPFPDKNYIIESVAPYKYSVVTNNSLNRTDAYVNMDIGGGSTDILYYKEGVLQQSSTKSRAYSVFFAANDLWGTGITPENRASKDNGFILNYERNLEKAKKEDLNSYKKVASNASDVVTYLFSKPENFHFADSIRQSPIAGVVVAHFAAIIYYLANVIKIDNLEVPACINFTGMGSKYIDIIVGDDNELLNIISVIFRYVGLECTKVSVSRDPNPKEVTALGAAYMLDPVSISVDMPKQKAIYCVDGEYEMEDAITYDDTLLGSTWELTRKELEKFMGLLKSQDFISTVRNLGVTYSFEDLSSCGFDENTFKSSYATMTGNFKNMSDEDKKSNVSDSLFLWSLKDTLYYVALRMANRPQ